MVLAVNMEGLRGQQSVDSACEIEATVAGNPSSEEWHSQWCYESSCYRDFAVVVLGNGSYRWWDM